MEAQFRRGTPVERTAAFSLAPKSDHDDRLSPRYAFWGDVRLDNRAELTAALGLTDQQLERLSDDDVVRRAYEAWGRDCPSRLLGDFAFAIHEPATGRTFCARDPAGVQPLYYGLARGHFIVGSEIEPLLEFPGISSALDEACIAAYLLGPFFHSEATFFEGIRKLPPGHSLIADPASAKAFKYWPPEVLPDFRFSSADDAAEGLRDLLVQAVRDRTRRKGPIGVHLSGGLDSSSVAAIAAMEARRDGGVPPDAFCWQPPPCPATRGTLEHRTIEAVSRQSGLRVRHEPPQLEALVELLCGDGARRPVSTLNNEYFVQRAAGERGISHILSGWGGDEFISSRGKGHLAELLGTGRWRELYRETQAHHDRPWRTLWSKALSPHLSGILQAQARRRRRNDRHSLIRQDFLRTVAPLEPTALSGIGAAARMRDTLSGGYVTDRIESWAIHGARHGITYSYPLLDRRILEFALTVPPSYFHREGHPRWLMRRAMEPLLPPEVCWSDQKVDPVRTGALRGILPDLCAAIRRRVEARSCPPSRARYVDMPHLMALLSAVERGQRSGRGRLWRTVSMLNLNEGCR